jgi:hypothetical protein
MCFPGIDEAYHEALLVVNFCKKISVFTNGTNVSYGNTACGVFKRGGQN